VGVLAGATSREAKPYNRIPMKSFFRVALLALLLVVVALVSALTAMRFAIHGQEVAVPALVGLTPADAERAAAALGLQIQIERQYYSAQIPEGRITSQLPMPGTKVRRGWDLRVAQSLGPQRVAIPDVAGESERAAELNIRRRGLDISSTAQMQMPGTPADQVLAQSPPANASQVAAPKINLLVTAAVDGQAYVMPSFIGQPLGTASRALQDSGFKLGNISVAQAPANGATTSPANSSASGANSAGATAGTPALATPAPGISAQSSSSLPSTAPGNAPSPLPGMSLPPVPPPQPTPASIIVSQTPAAGQKVVAGAIVNFEVR
jgi:eukaryotic-like serine/threonine-protein kinase